MNRYPNIASFGSLVIIAIIVMSAFADEVNAGYYSYSNYKSAEEATEEVLDTVDKRAEVEV